MTVFCGHVVALRRQGVGVVIHADSTHVWVSPVGGRNGPPNHRAEVRVDGLEDITAMGIRIKYPVVRCQQTIKIERRRLVSSEPLGRTPSLLMRRIMASVKRELAAQADEKRLMYHNDNASASMAVVLVG